MTKLRTLKDMEHTIGDSPIGRYMIFSDDLKAEAVKWVKFTGNGMKSIDDLLWEKLTGNTITYDEKTRECICVFIKHFFNLTEEDLK